MSKKTKYNTDEDDKIIFKVLRKSINPHKICDCCLGDWSNFTTKEEKLCDECYGEKYGKTKVG
jgi:predicted amidophosphoribosyltransferase